MLCVAQARQKTGREATIPTMGYILVPVGSLADYDTWDIMLDLCVRQAV